jgi:hypothetical protein
MYYSYPVTVTKETTEATRETTVMDLAAGQITQVEIGFPWGCAGLVHVQIYRSEHQMWPSNAGASFAWNDYTIRFPEAETCLGAPDEWTIRAWNTDIRHDHLIVVRIGILAPEKTLLGSIAQSLFGGRPR